ncbi:MAG: HlyD family secretion protein [Phycisphaerales bacterium]|jgi:multidrug efflux pump subunit AcrA (membrane-fusion protein)
MLKTTSISRKFPPLRYVLIPTIAIVGIVLVIVTVFKQVPRVPVAAIIVAPPKSPFDLRIAGIGTVLPSSDVVSVGTAIAGVVLEVAVTEGQQVKMGDLLFRIDGRQTQADLAVANARVVVAQGKLASVKALPRATTLREAQAVVASANAQLVDAQGRLKRLEDLGLEAATSRNEQPRLEYELAAAQAGFDRAQAQLEEVKQGAWAEDVDVAKSEVLVAQAEVARLQVQLERESVRAPIEGAVLYVDIDLGEHVVPGSVQQMVALGKLDPLHIRVQIDEMDAWRFRPEAKAIAMPRGGAKGEFPLRYLRMIPLIIPKHLLSGDSTERVDVRVMEVEYELDNPSTMSLLPGQLVDVFIEVPADVGN